eukprot:Partr_v1_DN24714_c0_g1_i5_m37284 putative N-6 adenine-specific DNA methyltransferase 1
MHPTPNLSHLKDFPDVYEPAEDTFLLMDTLEEELRSSSRHITTCLEIGSGSGCVSVFVGSILGESPKYYCTDINPSAVEATLRTAQINNVNVIATQDKFCSKLMEDLKGRVDLLIFNPPYVVTPSAEVYSACIKGDGSDSLIVRSWAGGIDGREVLDELCESPE